MVLVGCLLVIVNLYYYLSPLLYALNLKFEIADVFIVKLHKGGVFKSPLTTKLLGCGLISAGLVTQTGKGSNVSWVTLRDDSGKVLRITGGSCFTFAALPFSEFAIDDAAAAGRFPRAESEISLYIDCRIGDARPVKAGVYRMTLFFSSPVTTAD